MWLIQLDLEYVLFQVGMDIIVGFAFYMKHLTIAEFMTFCYTSARNLC